MGAHDIDLFAGVYEQLRELARKQLGREREGHTLQPTALVHEAWLRLATPERSAWSGRTHFFAVAAQCMRRILIDHARGHNRLKRGGDIARVTLDESIPAGRSELSFEDLLSLDEALRALAANDERQARIVELRYFAGMTVEEVAETLGVSKRTIEDEWTHARAWLRRRLHDSGPVA